jgi:hypothetical protein
VASFAPELETSMQERELMEKLVQHLLQAQQRMKSSLTAKQGEPKLFLSIPTIIDQDKWQLGTAAVLE